MSGPIIVPIPMQQPQRECITADGKVYCRKNEVSARETGFVLLAIAALFVWGYLAWKVSEWIEDTWRYDAVGAMLVVGVFIPILVIGLLLVL